MAVNIQENLSSAKIHDGYDVTAAGDVVILARNDTDAVVKADASATDSLSGVGVAVAINTVTHRNIAYMGTGSVAAKSLTVSAEIYEKEESEALEQAFRSLVIYLIDNGSINDVVNNARNSSFEDGAVNQFTQLQKKGSAAWTDEDIARIEEYVEELVDLALWKDGEETTLEERVDALIVSTWEAGNETVTADHAYAIEQYVLEALRAHYTFKQAPSSALYGDMCAPLVEELIALIDDYCEQTAYTYEMTELAFDVAEGKAVSDEDMVRLNAYLGFEANQDNMAQIRDFVIEQLTAKMMGGRGSLYHRFGLRRRGGHAAGRDVYRAGRPGGVEVQHRLAKRPARRAQRGGRGRPHRDSDRGRTDVHRPGRASDHEVWQRQRAGRRGSQDFHAGHLGRWSVQRGRGGRSGHLDCRGRVRSDHRRERCAGRR